MTVRSGIFYPDLSSAAAITLASGSTAAGYSITALQDANLSTTWKSGSTAAGFTFVIDTGASQYVSCVAILGHNLYSARNGASSYTHATISHSDDGANYTAVLDSANVSTDRITSDLPILCSFSTVTARYIKISVNDPNTSTAHAYEIADVFIAGRFLDLHEPTTVQWTPLNYKIASRTSGSDFGMGVPAVSGHVTAKAKIEIGTQAIDARDLFDDTQHSGDYPQTHAAPSFQHFVRTCYAIGSRFLFARFTVGVEPTILIRYSSGGLHSVACVAGDALAGVTTPTATAIFVSENVAERTITVRNWSGVEWVVGETIENLNRGPSNHKFASIEATTETSRQWMGVTICRATDGTAKIRTPFKHPTRRGLSLEFDTTAEWMLR